VNARAALLTRSAGARIRVRGLVQGVGFRPTVWRIARELALSGRVCNDGEGVLIEVWGASERLDTLVERLRAECPPLARIDAIEREPLCGGPRRSGFVIDASTATAARTGVVPDAGACPACIEETLSPFSRRYRYPFTNCTHCGPRLSIVRAIPYDRPNTSMAVFPMCPDCQAEYEDPADRRFHAQPNACHACGPRAWLERADGRPFSADALTQLDDVDAVCTLLQRGEIVAIKGVGGFHLACDATHAQAVERLRARKRRFGKPFALMARDLDIVRRYCEVDAEAERLLCSPQAPIVILPARSNTDLAPAVAPGQRTLGFMLPYTPLHHLLLKRIDRPVVMTSGNLSEEPQCIDNADARKRLGGIADWLLLHDREIVNRVDDSVVRVMDGAPRLLRRARGYAPAPLPLPPGLEDAPPLLAYGGELKNTFCLVKDGQAILSQHMGDLEDAATWQDYRRNLALYAELFQHMPQALVIDRHPEYLSAKLGRARAVAEDLALIEVQHHHAHVAACLADNGWPLDAGPVLGVALDGLGFGDDGTLWGGEFLRADYFGYERLGTFKPVAMPGGAQAVREPWRNTWAHLVVGLGWARYKVNYAELELTRFLEAKPLNTLSAMLRTATNCPTASSCGRLFDAVAAAIGVCRERAGYEGQAAVELEALVDRNTLERESDGLAYPFTVPRLGDTGLSYVEPLPMWQALLGDLVLDTPPGVMAARFHKGLARVIVHMVYRLTHAEDRCILDTVALTGGVFQNATLLEQVAGRLRRLGYRVLTHRHVPANDGGLALGQAVVGAARQLRHSVGR